MATHRFTKPNSRFPGSSEKPGNNTTKLKLRKLSALGVPRSMRVAGWKKAPRTVVLHQNSVGAALARPTIAAAIASLEKNQIDVVLTPALAPPQAKPYLEARFEEHKLLDLLSKRVEPAKTGVLRKPQSSKTTATTRTTAIEIGNARRRHYREVLAVDNLSFDEFWRYDQDLLNESLGATTTTYFRVAKTGSRVVGYSIAGTAQSRGYLQRLAVHPDFQKLGIGSQLLEDAMAWLTKRRTSTCSVNTQQGERSATHFYEKHGFKLENYKLMVLMWKRAP